MPTEKIFLINSGEAVTDGAPDGHLETEPAGGRVREGEAGQMAAPTDPAKRAKATESQDFPYFDFYPYGLLY